MKRRAFGRNFLTAILLCVGSALAFAQHQILPDFEADPSAVATKELDLAVKLVEALATKFEPEKFKDKYREQVEALIAAKIQGRDVASGQDELPAAAPVADIMEALKKSLAAAKKPPTRAEELTVESKAEPRAKRQARKR